MKLKEVIKEIKNNRDLMKRDFKDKQYGHIAKVLVKHYNIILHLLKEVE